MIEQEQSKAWLHGDLQGEVLGKHYVLDEKLGQGGMAWVYRATHRLLGGSVAVKILFPQLAQNEKIRTRFLREAQIQNQLEHPNIVRVLDFIDERGMVGFVSEWCNGGDLVHWHQAHDMRPLASGEIRSLFLPLLDAVHLAHEHHVIHRDLKPHNILLHQRGEILIPKLTDFGIAKQIEEQGLTGTGMVVGTVHYMSPEQLYESKSVDRRTDIYSLGVILYQMTSGRLPFVGEAPSLFMKIIEEKPPAIENIPPQYQAILDRCLAKKANDRFATCVDLRAALDQCLDAPFPLLPPGQAVTDMARQQALTGFNSAVSSPGMARGALSWNPGAVAISPSASEKQVAAIPSGEHIDPHAVTVIGANRKNPSGKSSTLRNMFILVLVLAMAAGGWWVWHIYPLEPATNSMYVIRSGGGEPQEIPDQTQDQESVKRNIIPSMGPEPTGLEPAEDKKDAGVLPEEASVVVDAAQIEESPEPPQIREIPKPRIVERVVPLVPDTQQPKVRPIVRTPKRSRLARLCERGQAQACYQLGQQEEKKKYWAVDYEKARQFYGKACFGKIGAACGALARLYREGKGGKKDLIHARYYFGVACQGQDALSCRKAGWFFQKGQGGAINAVSARYYYSIGCQLNDSTSCNLLGIMYSKGQGGVRDHRVALGLYAKACQRKDKVGCYNVGAVYGRGLLGARNLPVALGYYRASCSMGSGVACAMTAQTLWSYSGNRACSSINEYLRIACRLRYKQACDKTCASYQQIRPRNWLEDTP